MRSLALRVVVLWGWRRALVAFLAGALSVLALAPFHFVPVLALTFPLLVWLLDGVGGVASGRAVSGALTGQFGRLLSAAMVGWWFGFGYFLAGLYWVGFAFLVDADTFGWMLPFAVALLPAGLAFFMAAGTLLAYLFWSSGSGRIFALAVGLTGGEWLRGHVLTGFPWNNFGYGLAAAEPLMQAAALVGVYGLSFLCVLIFASPAVIGTAGRDARLPVWLMPAFGVTLFLVIAGYGFWRVPSEAAPLTEDVRLRLVQPDIAQRDKWQPENRNRIFADYLALSDEATSPTTSGVGDITHLIWPEAAVPVLLAEDEQARAAVAALLPPGTILITGALRRDQSPDPAKLAVYNSVMAFDDAAGLLAVYDKVDLVPFGEFLPFQDLLERVGLEQLTKMKGGFAAGAARVPIALPATPTFIPLICYEVIFSGDIVARGERPHWLLNVTNDAWFGDSTGPRQHLHQARLRAVEEGLPLVRAANTGISAIIDPYGQIIASLPLNARGVLDSDLPMPLPATVFARYGREILALMLSLGLLFAMMGQLAAVYGRRVRRR